MRQVKLGLVLLIGLLPASAIKNSLLNRLGHDIHQTARIGPVILLRVDRIEMGPESNIWSLSMFSHLRRMQIGEDVTIMRFNRAWAVPECRSADSPEPESIGVLCIDDHAVMTLGHSFDCSGGFFLGAWSGIGGREVYVSTHSYDPRDRTLMCAPTRVGVNSMVAARTTLAMGATLPDYCALGMGALLLPGATATHTLYGGIPARPIRDVSDWKAMSDRDAQRPIVAVPAPRRRTN